MIRNSFSIINGIGSRTEKKLWKAGILTWQEFMDAGEIDFISPSRKEWFNSHFASAIDALSQSDAGYFARTLRRREHWRLFEDFGNEAVYLDIETNGLMPGNGGFVTLVGIFDGFDYTAFVKDENLTEENLADALSPYKYLITFFGAGFDIPFLLRSMPSLKFDIPHFDLCFGARSVGFNGGLKKLEVSLGIKREEEVRHMNGYDAVKLWQAASDGSQEAMSLLKIYNREDTVNLFPIASYMYRRLRAETGIEEFLEKTYSH